MICFSPKESLISKNTYETIYIPTNTTVSNIKHIKGKSLKGEKIQKAAFKSLKYPECEKMYPFMFIQGYFIPEEKEKLYVLHIKNLSEEENKNTVKIIVSQNLDTDIGSIFPFLISASLILKCEIIAYDYKGHGCSTGKTSIDEDLCNDFEKVVDFTTKNLNFKRNNIVLLGISQGAVPVINYISKLKENRDKDMFHENYKESFLGVILISPYIRVIDIRYDNKPIGEYLNEAINVIQEAKGIENFLKKPNKQIIKLQKKNPYLNCNSNFIKSKNLKCPVLIQYGTSRKTHYEREINEMGKNIDFINIKKYSSPKPFIHNRVEFYKDLDEFIKYIVSTKNYYDMSENIVEESQQFSSFQPETPSNYNISVRSSKKNLLIDQEKFYGSNENKNDKEDIKHDKEKNEEIEEPTPSFDPHADKVYI